MESHREEEGKAGSWEDDKGAEAGVDRQWSATEWMECNWFEQNWDWNLELIVLANGNAMAMAMNECNANPMQIISFNNPLTSECVLTMSI